MTRVLIIEPGYCPYQAAFDSPQAAISEVIEGDSLLLKPFGTSKIGVVCSKNQSRLKYNRQLEDGCTIRGRFLVCGLSESKMLGLSKEQAERYNRLLFFPQVAGIFCCVPWKTSTARAISSASRICSPSAPSAPPALPSAWKPPARRWR